MDPKSKASKPHLGVYFENCKVYGRFYRNHAQTAYTGFCPKCRQAYTIPIGAGGLNTRFFIASCYQPSL